MLLDYGDELTYTAGTPGTATQSIVGNAGTAIVGGKVKDAVQARDWGAGEPLFAYMRVTAALAGASGGVQVDIVGADNAALTTNPVVLLTKTVAAAALTLNALIHLGVIAPGTKKRYLGVKLTPLTTNSTAGSVIVGLSQGDARVQGGLNAGTANSI